MWWKVSSDELRISWHAVMFANFVVVLWDANRNLWNTKCYHNLVIQIAFPRSKLQLDKDKINWTARLPPENIETFNYHFACIDVSEYQNSCFRAVFISILPNDVYVCTGLGSGLANTDMLETKTKALRGWEYIRRYHKNI